MADAAIKSLDETLEKYIPAQELAEVNRILYGRRPKPLDVPVAALRLAEVGGFELRAFTIGAAPEQLRPPRLVRVGLMQNRIVEPTTAPVAQQA